ncbi:hypothetical protein NEAUS04_2221 [Nematocida ausubeli]|uniref:Transcription initiation factor IIF subunit alpha n=1 Tax=Nematocida ausubeli (strain ATCC PRA-371 / ERTm2) TaxID=1913371 RepID=H8ZCD1_NEMA1|nr:uncharacterized protein NESG_02197 [Nematocida ausubeli]EHY65767.1 hypothetical protein NERG_01374 [Nematocida ausubeli]KAI5132855.1 hypothetical protein NEAUS06_0401 [Nematocida ausubeli]KAI5138126.1 hypothetical protein NEAUS07_2276 [Nematocida ausubeli]KAI5150834.1 hypothetical protein NEAUS05_2311 [Nematocida ausubeli]KAI5159535.1 hypothetical protein NEAUS03_0382 [Nematocida ausubeli]
MKHRVVLVNSGIERNIAAIHGMGDDLVPPLKLVRDPSLVIEDEEQEPANPAKITRKKAEILEYQAPEDIRMHKEERVPWLLEDSEQRSFIGRKTQIKVTEESKSAYYAMIKDKNEIKLHRIGKWYKFSPKIQYETLTLEEAEEKMQRKSKDAGSDKEASKRAVEEYKEDELEYKEVFDDDDGEIDIERVEKKKKRLDTAGKDLKKLVKNYEEYESESGNESESEDKQKEIAEVDVKMHLCAGPMPIKNLIEKFKMRFKANPKSKEVFRHIIKKICVIKTDHATGEKVLVLKEKEK